MVTKLKLKVELEDLPTDEIVKYMLYLTFIEKDIRFDANFTNQFIKYASDKYDFNILSSMFVKCGNVVMNNTNLFRLKDSIYLPSQTDIPSKVVVIFKDDKTRHSFIKRFYLTIKEWCDFYKPFLADTETIIELKDTDWTFSCEKMSKLFVY